MTFLYLWFACGLVAFVFHVVDESNRGKVLLLDQSLYDLFWAVIMGPVGLVAMVGAWLEGKGK